MSINLTGGSSDYGPVWNDEEERETADEIYEILENNVSASREEIASKVNLGPNTVEQYLSKIDNSDEYGNISDPALVLDDEGQAKVIHSLE